MKQIKPNGNAKIHNVRFYNIKPRSIQCMAYNRLRHKLAMSRNDGSIEIWDLQFAACLQVVIPKAPGGSVEGLIWANDRLFSVGLTGELVEWDFQTLEPRRKQFVTGNILWCIDVNHLGNELAVGTEEGFVNIIDVADDAMQYKSLFDKQEGRVLCCKYDSTGEYLVTGSEGAIRIWTVKDGHAIHKMSLPRMQRNKPTIVWALEVLSDFSIVSGDSRGCVIVWDGNTASQLESHQVLSADVLALTVNESEKLFMCSGIEPIIRIYAKTEIKREDSVINRWVKFVQRQVHDHDVKALVSVDDCILSGGVDGYLGITSASKTNPKIFKYGPFLKNPCVVVAQSKHLLLFRYVNYLEVWRLGSTSGNPTLTYSSETETAKCLPLKTMPEKLLELKSANEEPILCAAISPDANWLCYSTQHNIRLFRFSTGNNTALTRFKETPELFSIASHLQFSADSKRIFLINAQTKQLLIFAIFPNSTNELDFIECIEMSKHIKDSITLFTLSPCSLYIAVASADNTISVWCAHKGKTFRHHLFLPRYVAAPTAIAIHANQPRLVAAFSDGKILEYDLEDMCFTCSESDLLVENANTHCINHIVLDPRNPDIFIMNNDTYLFVVEKYNLNDTEMTIPNKKPMRLDKKDKRIARLKLKSKKSFEHLIHLSALANDELVAVCVNQNSLFDQLPGALQQKKFGA